MTDGPVVLKGERVHLIGKTRSGKTAIARALYLPVVRRKICLDVKSRNWLPDHHYVTDASELDWNKPAQVARPGLRWKDQKWYDDIYEQIWAIAEHDPANGVHVWLDEGKGASTAHSAPPALERAVCQGAEINIGHTSVSQRPLGFCPELLSQADHVIVMNSFYSPKDLDELAGIFGKPRRELEQMLDEIDNAYGKYSHLWLDVNDRGAIHLRPPMPEWMFK